MNKNKGVLGMGLILAIILSVIVIAAGAYYLGKKGSGHQVNNQLINTVTPTNSIVEQSFPSTNVVDSKDKNVSIYTSYKLGVKFKYALIDPMSNNSTSKVTESGNKISAKGGSLTVFDKNPNEDINSAVRRIILNGRNDFKNCSIKSMKAWNKNLDNTVRLAYGDGSLPGDENSSDCPGYFGDGRIFATSSQYPDRLVYIEYSTQSPDDILYNTKDILTRWESTIELISK